MVFNKLKIDTYAKTLGVYVLPMLLGLIVRLNNLDEESLWLDELICINGAGSTASWIDIYNVLHFWDQSPPLTNVLLHIYSYVVPNSDFSIRLFFVLWGIIAIGVFVWIALLLFESKSASLFCGLLVALHPYCIYFSREARPYIIALTFSALSIAIFYKVLKQKSKFYSVGYVLVTAALWYTTYNAVFIYGAQILIAGLWMFHYRTFEWKEIRYFILLFSGVMVLFTPWMYPMYRVINMWNAHNSDPTFGFVFELLQAFSHTQAPYTYFFLLGCVFAFGYCIKRPRKPVITYLILGGLIGITGMYLKSLTGRNVCIPFTYSYQIVLFPYFVLAIVGCYNLLKNKALRWIISFVMVAYLGYSVGITHDGLTKKHPEPYRELVQYLKTHGHSNWALFCNRSWDFNYYFSQQQLFIPKHSYYEWFEQPVLQKQLQGQSDTLLVAFKNKDIVLKNLILIPIKILGYLNYHRHPIRCNSYIFRDRT